MVAFTPTATTTYTITGDIPGCPGTLTTTVKTISVTSTPLAVSATVSPLTICAGSPATVTAAGASNFTFSPGPSSGGTVNTMVVNPISTTVYSVTGYNGTGCPGTMTISLGVNPVPTINAVASSATICNGSTVSLTASGGSNYNWTPGGAGTVIVVSPSVTSAYMVSGVNQFNCSSSTTTVVLVYNSPTVNASTNMNLICVGGSATLTASGAASYAWTNGPATNTYVVNPTTATSYVVTGSNQQGCTASANVSVNVFDPVLTVSPSTAICEGGSYELGASGAVSYTWNGVGMSASVTVFPTQTTSYTLSAVSQSNNLQCPATAVVDVTVNLKPVVTASVSRATICKNEQVVLTGGGAQNYTWTTLNNITGATVALTPTLVSTITYVVLGTDANGCQNTASVQLKVNSCNDLISNAAWKFAVFPNPGSGQFTIRLSVAANISVVNALGAEVRRFDASPGDTQVDLSSLSPGVYFLRDQAGESICRLVIAK
jgi:hypothetical protein